MPQFLNFFIKEAAMHYITVPLEPAVLLFYSNIAKTAGKSIEQVLSDTLFRLAGELSLQALNTKQPPEI